MFSLNRAFTAFSSSYPSSSSPVSLPSSLHCSTQKRLPCQHIETQWLQLHVQPMLQRHCYREEARSSGMCCLRGKTPTVLVVPKHIRIPSSISSGEIISFVAIARIHTDLGIINRIGGIAASFAFVLCWKLAREIRHR